MQIKFSIKAFFHLWNPISLSLSLLHSSVQFSNNNMMRSSTSSPNLEPLYKRDTRFVNKEKVGLFMLWILAITTIFTFFLLYTPIPFSAVINSQQEEGEEPENKIVIKPKYDYRNCDLFDGKWIPELSGPMYTNLSCSTIPISKKCGMHGRKDVDYLNWRWKPHGCELQRFDAKKFFRIVWGKTLAFIGDSVARNQMESLLCLLSQEETPIDMYKDNEDRFRTWYFPSHNFTIKVFWTKFFVVAKARVINGTESDVYDMHVDKVENDWALSLPGVDYAIISSGHWFFRTMYLYEKDNIIGCVYCYTENVTTVSVAFALGRAFRTALEYIDGCKECGELRTLLRTFSPAHFEYGAWNTGGRCNRTFPFTQEQINLADTEWELRTMQVQEIIRANQRRESTQKSSFDLIDVTKAMLMRPDGHPGLHWNHDWNPDYSDCVHWCLPGPIDAWNDLLMAVLNKDDIDIHPSSILN